MVNINIEIPDALHKQMKINALKEDKTLKDYIVSVLEAEVNKRPKTKS